MRGLTFHPTLSAGRQSGGGAAANRPAVPVRRQTHSREGHILVHTEIQSGWSVRRAGW